jgi:hypothetical protein
MTKYNKKGEKYAQKIPSSSTKERKKKTETIKVSEFVK